MMRNHQVEISETDSNCDDSSPTQQVLVKCGKQIKDLKKGETTNLSEPLLKPSGIREDDGYSCQP